MAMMVAAIGNIYVSNLNSVVLGKSRAIGVALVNEKIETLRDLPYDSVSTQHGTIYPPGNVLDDETVVKDKYTFLVHTDIIYFDDPYDGYYNCPCATGPAMGKPKDLYPYDYKKAQITIKLASSGAIVASATTDIAGKAAETASNTGILDITVLGADNRPIPNATVTIVNTTPNPDVNITTTTDDFGKVMVPKLPPDSNNGYQVTATLPGYSTDGTIPDPSGSQTAVELNLNVIAQQSSPITLKIDVLSTLNLHVVDTSGTPINNLSVTTNSSKQIKLNPVVYKYSQATATDASGNIALAGMEWDTYSFVLPSGYYLVSSSPYVPVILGANSTATANLMVSQSNTYPTIKSAIPISAQTGTAALSLKITGTNLSSGSTMVLKKSGQTGITTTGCVSGGSNTTLTCTANLTGAVTGAWDIAATKTGNTATQTGGLNVTP